MSRKRESLQKMTELPTVEQISAVEIMPSGYVEIYMHVNQSGDAAEELTAEVFLWEGESVPDGVPYVRFLNPHSFDDEEELIRFRDFVAIVARLTYHE